MLAKRSCEADEVSELYGHAKDKGAHYRRPLSRKSRGNRAAIGRRIRRKVKGTIRPVGEY